MAQKKRRHPKLPNGFGSIKKLSGRRRANPYGVYPPVPGIDGYDDEGRSHVKALCYVDTWNKGFMVLSAYHAGNYYPGYERTLNFPIDTAQFNLAVQMILSDYWQARKNQARAEGKAEGLTFSEVFDEYYEWKFNAANARQYSDSTKRASKVAFKNCPTLHEKVFTAITPMDMQKVLDESTLKHSSQELIINLFHGMYNYAMFNRLVDQDFSKLVSIKIEDDDESGVPFSANELKILWQNKENPIAEMILIMCYSGYRISAYFNMEVNLDDGYFKGGVKNKYSKDRIVPIHSGIKDLVSNRINRQNVLMKNIVAFRANMRSFLRDHGLPDHTPHDCRHTFSKLCEEYGVNENDRKRMMGHSFGSDITNRVYGHRDLKDLKKEIEKIQICR